MLQDYQVDVVIPVYNEGETIAKTLDALFTSNKTGFQVLICYDFEADTTLQALETYSPALRQRIQCVKNEGKGPHGAVCTGFRRSTAPLVIVWPADDAYNLGTVDALCEVARTQECDMVAASRFLPGGAMLNCPWLKALLVRTSSWTMHHIARVPTRDATNGLRLFSRRVLDELPIESTLGFAFSIELLVKVHRLGWKIREIPVLWKERQAGRSRFKVLEWLPDYLRWYFYAFATTYLFQWGKVKLSGPHAKHKRST